MVAHAAAGTVAVARAYNIGQSFTVNRLDEIYATRTISDASMPALRI